jgi:hypothetical protein
VSNIFLREKKDGDQRPVINLRRLNSLVPYIHFKMEGLKDVKDMLSQNDLMVKIDLKDAYLTIPLAKESRKLISFSWKGELFEFKVLCFGLGSAPRIFTKVLKVPISALRRLGHRLVIYLDDLIVMAQTMEEIVRARDTTIHILEHLGFVINQEKSEMIPSRRIEFLGVVVDSVAMTLSLPETKVLSLTNLCQKAQARPQIEALDLARVIGKLSATMPAVTHAMIQVRHLQMCLRTSLQANPSYHTVLSLSDEARMELKWWEVNLSLLQGKPLSITPPNMIIQSDAATSGGWGARCQSWETGGQWTKEESLLHINVQEMLAATLAVKTFTKWSPTDSILLQIDSQVALSYIVKQGGTKNLEMVREAKNLWTYLAEKGITLTAEWLPTKLNDRADFQSRNVSDSAEWKLKPSVFRMICAQWGQPSVDLFASRTSHQMDQYMSLKMDPQAIAIDAMQQTWDNMFPFAFPPFCLLGRVLKKLKRHSSEMILISPVWASQPWYPMLLDMSIDTPLLLPVGQDLLTNPQGASHPLLERSPSLQLAAWKICNDKCKQRAFRAGLSVSFVRNEVREQGIITTRPGRNSVAGATQGTLIPFNVV